MATRWRRRGACVLAGAADADAEIVRLSARAIDLRTDARPAIGSAVALRHPDAGDVAGIVDAHGAHGIAIRLDGGVGAVAWALAAIMADMSRAP